MTDDNKKPEEGAEEPVIRDASAGSEQASGQSEASAEAEELVEAEGPDVETSFTDEDLAFLAGEQQAETDAASEHLADLKRVTAEFANYRKRVDRDRELGRELAIAEVVKGLLPVLDDLALAETHGDLTEGPMVVIAQKFRASLEKFGLTTVGATGDVFDPHLHEALVQLPTPAVTVNTVADVIAPGYKLGERLLRPAKVAVSVPAE